MSWVLGLIGIGLSYVLVRYRQQIGDTIGEPDWAHKVGGIYNVMILCGLVLFFWSLAYLTGTMDILFAPIAGMFGRKSL